MKNTFKISSVLKARCPSCHQGSLLEKTFSIRPSCLQCNYNFYPEPGFYMGAMYVGFLLTAVLTIPPLIALKMLDADINIIILFPFVEFLLLGTFLVFYSRILWLHLEFQMTNRLKESHKVKIDK